MKRKLLTSAAVFCLISNAFIADAITLDLTALIESRYKTETGTMIGDPAKVYLVNSNTHVATNPSTSLLDQNGHGVFSFPDATNDVPYYIVIKHRNSIETWSHDPQIFTNDVLDYDFTTSASQAYGDNLKLVNSKYCIYSGDINQDGIVDGSDISLVENDQVNFVTGYVATDVTGDLIVDLADMMIVFNNNVVGIMTLQPFYIIDPTTGIANFGVSSKQINLYPNPVQDMVNFNIQLQGETIESVSIIDLLGKTVFQRSENAWNQNKIIIEKSIPSNIYFLQIKTDRGVYQRKFSIIN